MTLDRLDDVPLRHERVSGDGVSLHVVRAGDGPPIVLLHGFPETWRSWRRQIPALARGGFSVWVPDLRGYGESDRPRGRAAYELPRLVADVAAVVRATGAPRADIVAHDWGGVIAWTLAGHAPELVRRLVICNAPHMRSYVEKVRRPPQMWRSWYVLFFQLPWIPERALSAREFRWLRAMLRTSRRRPDAVAREDIEEYVRGLARPGALTAALNYYRANFRGPSVSYACRATVRSETLVIWGERDPALGLELLDGLERVAPRSRVVRIPDAGHWVQRQAADRVNAAILEFLPL